MHSALLRHYQVPKARNAWLPGLLAAGVNVLLLLALTWLQRGRPADTTPLRVRPAVLRDIVRPRPLRTPTPPRPEPLKRPPKPLKLERPKPLLERPKPQFAPMQKMLLEADLTPLKLRDALDVPVVVPPEDAQFETSAPVATPHKLEYGIGEVDEPPKQIRHVRPRYPSAAERKRIQGLVRIAFTVDTRGRVGKVEVLDSQPPGIFDEAAIASARRWRFVSGKVEGKPVNTRCSIVIRFRLEE